MTRALAERICREIPGAEIGDSRSSHRQDWTIGGAVFASLGPDTLAFRAADEASNATGQTPGAELPGGGKGWEEMPYESREADLRARIAASYNRARRALPGDVNDRLPVWTLPG